MQYHEKRQRTEEYNHLIKVVCDLCGKENQSTDWATGFHEKDTVDVTVKQRECSIYPEGGTGTEYKIDLCPECFKDRLVPWLRSEGANIRELDWES